MSAGRRFWGRGACCLQIPRPCGQRVDQLGDVLLRLPVFDRPDRLEVGPPLLSLPVGRLGLSRLRRCVSTRHCSASCWEDCASRVYVARSRRPGATRRPARAGRFDGPALMLWVGWSRGGGALTYPASGDRDLQQSADQTSLGLAGKMRARRRAVHWNLVHAAARFPLAQGWNTPAAGNSRRPKPRPRASPAGVVCGLTCESVTQQHLELPRTHR